jgi:hypothetical protein
MADRWCNNLLVYTDCVTTPNFLSTMQKTIVLPLLILLMSWCIKLQGQISKHILAKRITSAIKIDGVLDEPVWKEAPVADSFVEIRPVPFRKEAADTRTEVYFLYNDIGLYIGGHCHETTRDSMVTELIGRDNFGSNDFIGFVFDTYHDKINGFEYFLTPLGEQMDAKLAPNPNGNEEDFNWNAVWESKCNIVADGWKFELFIPFSAIRFSKKNKQDWGLNIVRKRNKTGQQLFWNPVDPQKNGLLPQSGLLEGLEDIKPPLRLSFSPYFSSYINNYPYNTADTKNTSASVNGGMDIKYGISQAFTVDMTLIPDFGQVQSDNKVLNLSPFEVQYNENRTFFTEGTELFNKGGLFYSRRIGGTPFHFNDIEGELKSNERIVKNPLESRLINATKLSGRTGKGLGIGLFNAVTRKQDAIVENDAKQTRSIENDPLTNYNIFVLDQTLKNNSSISVINTSVLRSGIDYDANVTAALFNLFDKKNKWNFFGKAYTSTLFGIDNSNKTGFKSEIGFGKVSGKFNFQITQTLHDENFNFNDLGYMNYYNFLDHYLYLGYNFVKPKRIFNRLYHNFNFNLSHRFKPFDFQKLSVNYNLNGQLKNLWYVGANFYYSPQRNDFYEPRVNGKMFRAPADRGFGAFLNTNRAKRYSGSADFFIDWYDIEKGRELNLNLGQLYRVNDKISFQHDLYMNPRQNNLGFTDKSNDSVIIGRRFRQTVENVLRVKYSFSNTMFITFRARHYWSKVRNKEFYFLNNDGSLQKNISYYALKNENYNTFNIDMVYSWRFAPGSEVNIVWKNAIGTSEKEISKSYFQNLNYTLGSAQNNNLSFKILYYIDYLQLRKKRQWG